MSAQVRIIPQEQMDEGFSLLRDIVDMVKNPKQIEEAHKRLLWALIGAGVILGAVAISKVVETTVNAVMGKS